MADKENQIPEPSVEPDQRARRIEAMLEENELLRQKRRRYSIFGMLGIIAAVALFCMRLYGHVSSYNTEELQAALLSEAEENLLPEAELLLEEIKREKLVDQFKDQLVAALKAEAPNIQKETGEMADRLLIKSQTYVEKRLVESMTKSLGDSEEQLQEIFPEFNPNELEASLQKASDQFVGELNDVLEARVGQVSGSLEGLRSAVVRVTKSGDSAELHGMSQEEVQEILLDAVIDVVFYEFRPALGQMPAEHSGGPSK
jgi:hypothetical protein